MRRRVGVQPRGGSGLVNTMARTAVVAGTAKATVNAMDNAAAKKEQQMQAAAQSQADLQQLQAQMAEMQAQQAQAALPTADAPQADMIEKLQQLAQLKDAGVLSDEEFEAAKAKLLGM